MRGTHAEDLSRQQASGIIPADAGNTTSGIDGQVWLGNHPRGCGEHPPPVVARPNPIGSSPRMRGTLHAPCRSCGARGIIPADAGNTRPCQTGHGTQEDHPRGCGEHLITPREIRCRLGSSPRMRGTRSMSICLSARMRIIPADAGNTREMRDAGSRLQDHPRGCGEHSLNPGLSSSGGGSSTRMRGTPSLQRAPAAPVRIIPADAGNTRWCPHRSG